MDVVDGGSCSQVRLVDNRDNSNLCSKATYKTSTLWLLLFFGRCSGVLNDQKIHANSMPIHIKYSYFENKISHGGRGVRKVPKSVIHFVNGPFITCSNEVCSQ